METFLSNLAVALIVAVATSYLTVRLSVRQFRSQKWWEKKQETYSEILKSLSDLKIYAEVAIDEQSHVISKEQRELRSPDWSKAQIAIDRIAHIGPLMISKEADAHLATLREELMISHNEKTIYDIAEAQFAALEKALENIRACARRDLEV